MTSRLIPQAEAMFFPENTPLPVEITSLIVDSVMVTCTTKEARFTLRSCLVLSRSFWLSAREKLFRVLNIDETLGREAAHRLASLLSLVRPHDALSIVPCIRELSISFDSPMFESVLDDRNGTLADILTNLSSPGSQVTHFSLQCDEEPGLNWVNISTYLNRAIRQFTKIGTLDAVVIRNVYNLPIPFFHGGHFHDLRLAGTSYRLSQMVPMLTDAGDFVMRDPEAGPGPPPSLHSLSTHNDSLLLCFARPNEAPLATLHSFKTSVFATTCIENIGLVFQQAYQSLETCSLKLRPQSNSISNLPKFDALHRLTTLELLIPIDIQSNMEDPLIPVASLLNISAPISRQVHMTVIFLSSRKMDIHLINHGRWNPIDRNLADPMKFGAAGTKEIELRGPGSNSPAGLKVRGWLQKSGLRRCFSAGRSPYRLRV
ncbi:hypothetical protein CPB83DRAFT_849330 [Crepidotus variabilis]|uniref:Uncharacterized protein n=1 Tax=Crepidotus variabilis TaxID=179855 RepID=A0A9P6EJX3_9AGAR|nr:hypothetical protein CPB83DRAFT_849330 [Crepidotus variabilis]